jgi:hypothetical protein
MVMRFMGGGVGHKATNVFTQVFAREARNLSTNLNCIDGEPLEDENAAEDSREEAGDSDSDAELELEEELEDYGYVIESELESEDGDEEDDEDLGGEDGEEPWEMDDVQAECFDDL